MRENLVLFAQLIQRVKECVKCPKNPTRATAVTWKEFFEASEYRLTVGYHHSGIIKNDLACNSNFGDKGIKQGSQI